MAESLSALPGILLIFTVALLLGRSAASSRQIPAYIGLDCNQYQLFTCLGSRRGSPIQTDCCEAIRNVLNPRCLCSPNSVSKTIIKSLIPIAATCEVLLVIGEPCERPPSPPPLAA